MQTLVEYLTAHPPGPIAESGELATQLTACWGQFTGNSGARVPAPELPLRLRNATWRPPILSFELAQAAAANAGDPHPDTLRWVLDVEQRTAALAPPAHASFPPARPKHNMLELAEQIVRLILARREDLRLRWYSDGSVRVAVGAILPEGVGFKQTVSNRRKKFRLALDEQLPAAGWRKVKDYVFAPPAAPTNSEAGVPDADPGKAGSPLR